MNINSIRWPSALFLLANLAGLFSPISLPICIIGLTAAIGLACYDMWGIA